MEPGVPFALLGAVELLTVAAWIVLAVAGIGLSRGAVVARVLAPLMTGALLLATVAAGTGLLLGTASSNVLTLLRAAGLIGVGVGLYAGALGARRDRPLPDGVGVVVPLAAGAAPSLVVGVAGLAAALAGLRGRAATPSGSVWRSASRCPVRLASPPRPGRRRRSGSCCCGERGRWRCSPRWPC